MRKIKLVSLLLLLILAGAGLRAAVSEYSFASAAGTFTEIAGGTVLGTSANDNDVFNAIPLGFTFTYNGVDHTQASIASNGFLALGAEVVTSNLPISNATTTNNVVSALGRDIKSRADGELMYLQSGAEPNRVFTVQWKHWRRSATAAANDDLTFQIQLQENGDKVVFAYGPFTAVTSSTNQSIQVGLRGDANTDFNNRATTTDWAATNPGTANNSFCVLSATVFPASGLAFTFSPPTAGEPPLPAVNPNPANNAVDVAIGASLNWVAGGGTVDGYKVYLGTDNPPSNLVNGTSQTPTSYDPANFNYSTTYYWRIVPFNANGDAPGCPVWQFTTLADPTVTTFPYAQNFDAATPPALPLGWTAINANGDTYSWETYAGTAQSQPNSARIRFNTTLAMNDWLLLPPLQLTEGSYYKLRFYYRGGSADAAEKLALYWGMSPTADALSNQIWANENITNVSYQAGEGVMQAPGSGIYHFGFKGYSAADLFYIYLDTVTFDVWVEQLLPPTNLAAAIDGNDVHLSWAAPVETRALLGYKVYRNGTLVATIPDPDSLTWDDLALPSGLYSYGVAASYTSGDSPPAGPVLADVDPVILPPANLTATIEERDIVLNWGNPEGDWITWSNLALGNSIGTSSAIVFDVAHRWPQADLAPYAGRSITRIEFVPVFASCVYTVKVWTGGSATSGGTLVHSQVVSNPVMNVWNTVILTAQIPIPATGDLYYGYEVNTTGGNPAGCDSGPQIEGKGNMMYFGGTWTTLTALDPALTYNWNIRAFAQFAPPPRDDGFSPLANSYYSAPQPLTLGQFTPPEESRLVTGYKVYRDGVLIATLDDEEDVSYRDAALPNATYVYGVTSVAPTGESVPASVTVTLNFQLAQQIFGDGFEDHPDFATTFAPWTLRDLDQSTTYGMTDVTFPGSGNPMAYIVFNPGATTPPVTAIAAHGGAKMAASFGATTPPNNDWLVTPRFHLGTDSAVKFFARSHTDAYGLERFRVGVCTLPSIITQGFQWVNDGEYVEAPTAWHEYVYDLSAYDGQNVFIGIRCVSNDAFVFYVDDFTVHSDGGYVGNDDEAAPALVTALLGNFPNPFNPETAIRFSLAGSAPVSLEVYNLRGQLVRQLLRETRPAGNHSVVFNGRDDRGNAISSGVYFYRLRAGSYSATRKMIMIK